MRTSPGGGAAADVIKENNAILICKGWPDAAEAVGEHHRATARARDLDVVGTHNSPRGLPFLAKAS
jgi:hypothetical protein